VRDLVHGENVLAYVALKPGAPAPTELELIDFARARVGYKGTREGRVSNENQG
jgi:long-chain acyl-CoA synthetase